MNAVYITITVVILIITLRIRIEIKLEYNLLNNIGTINIRLFKFFTILNSQITVIEDYLNVSTNKKIIKIKLDINDFKIKFFNELNRNLNPKIHITQLYNNINFCLENPFMASVFSNTIRLVFNHLLYKVKLRNKDAEINNIITTGFRHNIIIINFKYAFIITLFDLVWSIIKTILVLRRDDEKAKNSV